jgi:hypothetical protein
MHGRRAWCLDVALCGGLIVMGLSIWLGAWFIAPPVRALTYFVIVVGSVPILISLLGLWTLFLNQPDWRPGRH